MTNGRQCARELDVGKSRTVIKGKLRNLNNALGENHLLKRQTIFKCIRLDRHNSVTIQCQIQLGSGSLIGNNVRLVVICEDVSHAVVSRQVGLVIPDDGVEGIIPPFFLFQFKFHAPG